MYRFVSTLTDIRYISAQPCRNSRYTVPPKEGFGFFRFFIDFGFAAVLCDATLPPVVFFNNFMVPKPERSMLRLRLFVEPALHLPIYPQGWPWQPAGRSREYIPALRIYFTMLPATCRTTCDGSSCEVHLRRFSSFSFSFTSPEYHSAESRLDKLGRCGFRGFLSLPIPETTELPLRICRREKGAFERVRASTASGATGPAPAPATRESRIPLACLPSRGFLSSISVTTKYSYHPTEGRARCFVPARITLPGAELAALAPKPAALIIHEPVAAGSFFCNRFSKYIQPEDKPAATAAFNSGLLPGCLNPKPNET